MRLKTHLFQFIKQCEFFDDPTILPGKTLSGIYSYKIYRLKSKVPWVLQKVYLKSVAPCDTVRIMQRIISAVSRTSFRGPRGKLECVPLLQNNPDGIIQSLRNWPGLLGQRTWSSWSEGGVDPSLRPRRSGPSILSLESVSKSFSCCYMIGGRSRANPGDAVASNETPPVVNLPD